MHTLYCASEVIYHLFFWGGRYTTSTGRHDDREQFLSTRSGSALSHLSLIDLPAAVFRFHRVRPHHTHGSVFLLLFTLPLVARLFSWSGFPAPWRPSWGT